MIGAATDVIFLKPELSTALVTTYGDNGGSRNALISRYKYFVRVRNVDTQAGYGRGLGTFSESGGSSPTN